MSGKRTSKAALSTSASGGMKTKRRNEGHCDPLGRQPTTANWFDIPEIVEKVLSYLDKPSHLERAAMVNKTFRKFSWRATKDFFFHVDMRIIYGPFPAFVKRWKQSDMANYIPIIWNKCFNLRNLKVRVWESEVSWECDYFLFTVLNLQRRMKRKIECLFRFRWQSIAIPGISTIDRALFRHTD